MKSCTFLNKDCINKSVFTAYPHCQSEIETVTPYYTSVTDPFTPEMSHSCHGHGCCDEEIGEAVENAHKLENPLSIEALAPLQTGTLKDGKSIIVKHFKASQLTPPLLKFLMDLMERNMKKMYRKAEGGWKPKDKKREMTSATSRHLIAFIDDKPVAFSHFRFDMDYGREVLYCYEIQVDAKYRSCGLGKHIMEALEKIAKQTSLALVVLTVFKFNLASLAFFKTLGYTTDETCPTDEEKRDYVILSKKIC